MAAKHAKNHRSKAAPRAGGKPGFMLRLFIAGMSSRSVAAIASIKRICEENLDGRYQLEIVDLYRHPHKAQQEQIVAAPTLVKQKPLPVRRIIGSLTDEDRVITGLNMKHG